LNSSRRPTKKAENGSEGSKDTLVTLQSVGLHIRKRPILDRIDLKIHAREILTIIGPNGAGKSSLARIVLGLQQPTAGAVFRRRNLRIGYVPQQFHIDPAFPVTVKRFLNLADNGKHWQASLQSTAMLGFADQPLSSLSGGELQRVLLSRALQLRPQLLVLDEPAQGIDLNSQQSFYQLIRQTRDELQCAVLLISHDLHLVMAATDKVLCLNGHICCAGHPETISNDPSFVQLFGQQAANSLAIYHHHHDHHHHTDGTIAAGSECQQHGQEAARAPADEQHS